MIARITRALLVLQLIVAAGIGWLVSHRFHIASPMVALFPGIAFVLLLRLLITANNFFLAWRYASKTPAEYQLNLRQACKLFFGEYRATMTSSSWTMPFRAFSKRIARQPSGLPVLLIHGYGCNSGYWHPMSKVLAHAGISHCGVNLEPITCGIDDYVPLIDAAVERLCSKTGHSRIVIVAHSMGGLATRAYLRSRGTCRIAKVVTLGTPHHGTALAQFGFGINTVQMRWAVVEQEELCSPWLRTLVIDEDEGVYRLFVSIFSHHDNIISPQTSSYLAGAKNIGLYGIGHVALAFHPLVQSLVIDEIRAASLHGTEAKISETP